MESIYLDNNATTRIDPQVVEALSQAYEQRFVNPASQHQAGQRTRRRLEQAAELIIRALGGDQSSHQADSLVFTSGGTEANNLAILGLGEARAGQILVSAVEHPSVSTAAMTLLQRGRTVHTLPVDSQGVVRLDMLVEHLIDGPTALVSVMLGNNETGVLQPIEQIAQLCHTHGVPLHVDAVQAVGKIPIYFRQWGLSALTLSAHKLHGPRGIGGLLLAPGMNPTPQIIGGSQQLERRAGTENPELAIGLQRAIELAVGNRTTHTAQMARLRDTFEERLKAVIPDLVIHGPPAKRLPHTSNVAFPGIDRQGLVMALDMVGVYCSTGSACASGSSEPSPTLLAMGLNRGLIDSSLRFSFARDNTLVEMEEAVRRISSVVNNLRQNSSR
ncbi:MAG: cysteine desulfurase family protein [Pirellulaceae bacterium]